MITGGGGFIGVNLIEYLLQKDKSYNIICVDNFISSNCNNIKELKFKYPQQITIIEIDICRLNLEILEHNGINKIDQIYHLACMASPKYYQKYPIKTLDTCYIGTKNILDIAEQYKSRIVYSSTSEVYGDPEKKIQDEMYRGNVNTVGIRSCYDEGKRVGETLCFEYKKEKNVNVGIVRIFNTYGPYMDSNDGRVIPNFINQCLQNLDITIYGDGTQTRSFCYEEDLILGLEKMMNNNKLGPINLGNENEFTINQLALKVKELIKSDSKVINLNLPQDDPL